MKHYTGKRNEVLLTGWTKRGPDVIRFMWIVLHLSRYPNQDLEMTRNNWRANVQEIERKISTAEVDEFIAKMFSVKNYHSPGSLCLRSLNAPHGVNFSIVRHFGTLWECCISDFWRILTKEMKHAMPLLCVKAVVKTWLYMVHRHSTRSRLIKQRMAEESVSCLQSTSTTSPNLQHNQ